jgi:hypothetical protein
VERKLEGSLEAKGTVAKSMKAELIEGKRTMAESMAYLSGSVLSSL